MGKTYSRTLFGLLVGVLLIGNIGSETMLLAHTQTQFAAFCDYLRDNRDRSNNRTQLVKEQRLWRNFDNEVAAIYSTYDSDTWSAWQLMSASMIGAELTYKLTVAACTGNPPCLSLALGGFVLASAGIQATYQTSLNDIEHAKDVGLLASNNKLQSGLAAEDDRHSSKALEIADEWKECIENSKHHTTPHPTK